MDHNGCAALSSLLKRLNRQFFCAYWTTTGALLKESNFENFIKKSENFQTKIFLFSLLKVRFELLSKAAAASSRKLAEKNVNNLIIAFAFEIS